MSRILTDIAYLILMVSCFAACAAFARLCERLK
jgi:hypothetical protein